MIVLVNTAARLLTLLTLITGIVYPILFTIFVNIVFPYQANGSIAMKSGQKIGSHLIGQSFAGEQYFWARNSATSPFPYNPMAGSATNHATTNPALRDSVKGRMAALKRLDPQQTDKFPVDLVTSSASGLDPHISPASALFQIRRIARVRGVSEATLRKLVQAHTEPPTLGILGQSRVHVWELNATLDALRTSSPSIEDQGDR